MRQYFFSSRHRNFWETLLPILRKAPLYPWILSGGAAVWLQKIIKEENEAREEKLEVQTKEIECLKKQLRDISVLEVERFVKR